MPISVSTRDTFFRYAFVLTLFVCGCVVVANLFGFYDGGRIVPALELIAIATVGIYTIFVASRIRRSDVAAVVPNRILEALDSLADGLLILDENRKIILANQAFSTAVGIATDQLIGIPAESLSWDTEQMSDGQDFPWDLAIQSGNRQAEQLIRFRHRDGSERVFSINCSPITGQGSEPHIAQETVRGALATTHGVLATTHGALATTHGALATTHGALATFRDVTQIEEHRAELNSRLRHLELLAAHDPLTECLNRRALVPKMQSVWDLSFDHSQPLSCLMIDNDHFKQINDTHGHEVGDNALRLVASAIRASVPKDALVCRYGGEEFCVVLQNTSIERATELAEATRTKVEAIRLRTADQPSISADDKPSNLAEDKPSISADDKPFMSVSIGVSETRFGAQNPQELITQADQCLYLAKHQGRNRVVVMSASVVQLLQPEQPGKDRN